MRLYFRSPQRDRTYGVDVLVGKTGPGLTGALVSPAFLAKHRTRTGTAPGRRSVPGAVPS